MVKAVPEEAVPQGAVTATTPVEAPAGTVAVIVVLFTTVNEALVPLNVTAVAPVNPVPLIVTRVPAVPAVGEKPETVTAGNSVTIIELDKLVQVLVCAGRCKVQELIVPTSPPALS